MTTRSKVPSIFDGPYDEPTRLLSYKHPLKERPKGQLNYKQPGQKIYLITEKRPEKRNKTQQLRRSARLKAKREEMAKLEKR